MQTPTWRTLHSNFCSDLQPQGSKFACMFHCKMRSPNNDIKYGNDVFVTAFRSSAEDGTCRMRNICRLNTKLKTCVNKMMRQNVVLGVCRVFWWTILVCLLNVETERSIWILFSIYIHNYCKGKKCHNANAAKCITKVF